MKRAQARKTIFQLVVEKYNISQELNKIKRLFDNEKYFCDGIGIEFSLSDIIGTYLFKTWAYKDTCIDIKEYFERVVKSCANEEEKYINFLEVMENFCKLYFDNSDDLYDKQHIEYYESFEEVFINLIHIAEKRLGLTKREYKDKTIIYPKNATLEKALDNVVEEEVQWELIRYEREDLSLAQKKKSLAFLATNLSIQQDKKEDDVYLISLLDQAGNILNNLHIRHNNKIGKSKNEILKYLTNEDQIKLCDMLYSIILNICIVRDLKKYNTIYKKFNDLQKVEKAKDKTTGEEEN